MADFNCRDRLGPEPHERDYVQLQGGARHVVLNHGSGGSLLPKLSRGDNAHAESGPSGVPASYCNDNAIVALVHIIVLSNSA